MGHLFHRLAALSIAAAIMASPVQAAAPTTSGYYGRWIVSEDRPVFTARGRQYKTFDVAPCGNDFCGVSVDDSGRCGATLFRFLGRRASQVDALRGHGRWGNQRKNIAIFAYGNDADQTVAPALELYLGDGTDFGGRSDNMPSFHAEYRRTGAARCTVR